MVCDRDQRLGARRCSLAAVHDALDVLHRTVAVQRLGERGIGYPVVVSAAADRKLEFEHGGRRVASLRNASAGVADRSGALLCTAVVVSAIAGLSALLGVLAISTCVGLAARLAAAGRLPHVLLVATANQNGAVDKHDGHCCFNQRREERDPCGKRAGAACRHRGR
jgi:hypothetical protein